MNRFNLVDEPWVPMADVGRVSLRQVFSTPGYRILAGNPVQMTAVRRLLLAIVQMACTPVDEPQWLAMGPDEVARQSLLYLERWHDRFWLYGERPFLQMRAISRARVQGFDALLPEVSAGNTTVLTQSQQAPVLDDADKALLIVVLMGFPLGGKKADNSVVLTPGYTGKSNPQGKPATARPGPAMAHRGLLHNYLLAQDLWHTLWLNLLTAEQIGSQGLFPNGCGVAPWERMPEGEACPVAERLKGSLMGHLVPMARFCYLARDGVHYSEGLAYPGYKEGFADPSVAIDYSGKEPKALWANPDKRPWRELSSLLAFVPQHKRQSFQCWRIQIGLNRAHDMQGRVLFWSGGLRVSTRAGEQYVGGRDDFVESQVWLHTDRLDELWFRELESDMQALNDLAKSLYACVMAYFRDLSSDGSTWAARATQAFWQQCEADFQTLVDHCGQSGSDRHAHLFRGFSDYACAAYDQYCPRETARQLDVWAKCEPIWASGAVQARGATDAMAGAQTASTEASIVHGLLASMRQDARLVARLRRSDSLAMDHAHWKILAGLGVDLEEPTQRIPFAIVATALARAHAKCSGHLGLGQAIAACHVHGAQSRMGRTRLRHLLACTDLSELPDALFPLLTLINTRVSVPLDHVRLLRQLRQFATEPQAVREQWAREFHAGRRAGLPEPA
ncbi:type I-E CRISPR-associated protein Cse1/CasA [Castellaniella sp.]